MRTRIRMFPLWPMLLAAALLSACQEPLYSGLAEGEANQMRQVLLQKGIDADKRQGDDGKQALFVASGDMGRALRELERNGLPKHKYSTTMDVLRSDSLVANPAEDRARLAWALSQEIAATISAIDGVVTARVHLVLPEKPAFGGLRSTPAPASAAVFVKHKPGYNLQPVALGIKQLVARSVEGLVPEQVNVTLLPATQTRPDSPQESSAPVPEPTATRFLPFVLGALLGLCAALALAHARRMPAVGRMTASASRLIRGIRS